MAYTDYKEFLKDTVEGQWGLIGQLAKAAQCQSSYLSQVLRGKQQLTLDHAFGIAKKLKLTPLETQYFMTLLQKEKASSLEFQTYLDHQIRSIKTEAENLTKRLKRNNQVTTEFETVYFSAWYWVAIHILSGIKGFHTAEKIAQRLHLSTTMVQHCLNQLFKFQLVEMDKNGFYRHSGKNIHTPRESVQTYFHHGNWRTKALQAIQENSNQGIHFTDVRSISKKDFEQLRALIFETIEKYSFVADPSESEQPVVFNIDYFSY